MTTLTITNTQPAFDGASFGSVGTYEVITGTFTDEVDPSDPHNAVITDVNLGPKNPNGTVSFTADFQIIKPTSLANSAHRVIYDIPNRGGPGALGTLNGSSSVNTAVPASSGTAGNGFLMNMGWTIVEVGWDLTAPQGGTLFGITLPVAKNPDGSAITGRALEELVVDQNATPATLPLTYAAVTADQSQATLTVRENYGDAPQLVPSSCWAYTDSTLTAVKLTTGNFGAAAPPCGFGPTALYEFSYTATNPNIVGLGFAAIRDLATFLRDAKTDDGNVANPLAGDVKYIYTICGSQPCRTTRDFVYWGFNEADIPEGAAQHQWGDRSWWDHFWLRQPPHHERAIDGMLNYIGGGNGIYTNYRFAQPTRTQRQHIARWFPEFQFPFADLTFFDPVTQKIDGRLARCEDTKTCPKIFEANSENEFWAKGGSMLLTNGQGHDLDLSRTPNVRYYVFSSFQHGTGNSTTTGICRQLGNPLSSAPVERALLVDLDQWASEGVPPPPNQVPRISDGTLVPPLPSNGFPQNIPNPQTTLPATPNVVYNGILHTGDLWDFGPQFDEGIISTIPPESLGTPYKIFVPKTDADGNDIAGIRVPSVSVPIATYTGWGLRAGNVADPVPIVDGCDATGQYIPFPNTISERMATGDPRPSLQERYGNAAGTNADYVAKVQAAADALVNRRLLLEEPGIVQDVEFYTVPAMSVTIPANP
ncbi:MAG: hypothetical protein JOZ17_04880 [Acetobacteraceae bacterium]|nr:hypothetical protein [Acetobacteraceae bacterium]